MDSDSDDYDYLSYLKSGFDKSPLPSIESVNNSSDTYDSDSDCVLIECVKSRNGTKDDKTDANPPPTQRLTEQHVLTKEPIVRETLSKCCPQNIDQNLNSIAKVIDPLKGETKSAPIQSNEISVKTESLDVKPDIKPKIEAPDSDIKPFVLKIESDVKNDESPQLHPNENTSNKSTTSSKSTDTREESIKTSDFSSRDSFESNESHDNGSNSSDNRFALLVEILGRIREEHQKPTFNRILTKYSRATHELDHKSSLVILISDAIQKRIIEKVEGIDESDVSYKTVGSIRKRKRGSIQNFKSHRTSKSSQSSSKESNNTRDKMAEGVKSDPQFSNRCTANSDDFPELDSLALEGYTDISDIELSSVQSFFGDTELEPQIFDNCQLNTTTPSPTSLQFNSTPIKSFNHNRKNPVIPKDPDLKNPVPKNGDNIDKMLSLKEYSNWFLEPLPKSSPYIAQKGDRVVYLRDTHQIYIDYELKELLGLYEIYNASLHKINESLKSEDYVINCEVTDVRFYQINYIKFSVITLKNLSNENPVKFNVLYRPNRGISDFLILEFIYTNSQKVEWEPQQEFRSLWKKSWWLGTVCNKSPFNTQYPNSLYKCYEVIWYTNEKGRLNPWDMSLPDPNRKPKRKDNGIVINREDLFKMNYMPHSNEWPEVYGLEERLWRCSECRRIYSAIKYIEENVDSLIFSTLNDCQNSEIVYPVKLTLIKERLKNLFYRRKESIIADITYLKINAKLYVKKCDFKICEDFVDLLLGLAIDRQSTKSEDFALALQKYPHLKNTPQLIPKYCASNMTPDPQKSNLEDNSPTADEHTASSTSVSNKRNQLSQNAKSRKRRASENIQEKTNADLKITENTKWKEESHKFLDQLMKTEDSMPYRQPVDLIEFPHYRKVIGEPIDLSEIQRKLNLDQYPNPTDLRKDFRLMFQNAKVFNKDSKSKIRTINKNLSNLAEDRLREIIVDWERVFKYEQKRLKTSGFKVREPIARNQLWGFAEQQYY